MRILVADWLNAQSGGRYSCAQEPEHANKQKPDILILNPDIPSPVPIELKLLDQGWTGPKLCERLRNQLAGDYLREETAGCGIMLLIWQGRSTRKHWEILGKRVLVSDLGEAMLRYWDSTSDKFPGVAAIDVIVIDLTIRETKSDA